MHGKCYYIMNRTVMLLLFVFFFNCTEAQTMKYVSSRLSIADSPSGNHLMKLEILTAGNTRPLSLTTVSVDGRKLKEFETGNIKIYCTETDSTFSPTNFFGSSASKKAVCKITGAHSLKEGANYFWLMFDQGELIETLQNKISFELAVQEYQLVWSDEFNGNKIDTANWSFENGFVRNDELQWYQQQNAFCANGVLTIEARKESKMNPDFVSTSTDWRKSRDSIRYTSSSIRTAGKQSWLYGRFEMKARIDTISGYWPAWWTLGVSKRWPSNGEIDIMEFYRGKLLANYAVGTSMPSTAFWFSNTKPVSSFNAKWKDKFHLWRLEWDEDGIGIYVDDILLNYQSQSNLYNRDSTLFFPFKQPHYMLLNLAIGGDNGGDPVDSFFPLKYQVDYVRVSQKINGRFSNRKTYQPKIK